MKIMVIQQKMIGDVLTSSILFEALRQKYPEAELHYLINTHTLPVVQNHPHIDRFILFTPDIEKSKRRLFSFIKKIKAEKYDVVIDVYGKLSSNLVSLFSGAPKRIAYHKKHTAWLYTDTFQRKKTPNKGAGLALENRMKLLKPLGIDFSYITPKIYLTIEETQAAKAYLAAAGLDFNRPLYMIGLLGSGSSKTYPEEYMAALLDQTVKEQPKAQLLFNYMPAQTEAARAIYDRCAEQTKKQIHFSVLARSLREYMAFTYHCTAYIGNEGGAANMAKALEVSSFIIFCPFINKSNWFGRLEAKKHTAVHLSDYEKMTADDLKKAKKNPGIYYKKMSPNLLTPELMCFIEKTNRAPKT